jgi:arylsulfatase A
MHRYRPMFFIFLLLIGNLATAQPQRAQAMLKQLRDWHQAIGAAIPQLNPHYDATRALKEAKEKLKP